MRSGYVLLTALLLVGTDVSARKAAPRADLSRIPGTPVPPRGKLWADCLAQSTSAGTFDETSNKDAHLLRFHCAGAPAKALYDELATWSALRHSEWSADGRTWRSAAKIVHDLFDADYCSTDNMANYQCELTVNVGPFLDG